MNELFKIEDVSGTKDGMLFDRKVIFYDEKKNRKG